jgi:hypothetical protein
VIQLRASECGWRFRVRLNQFLPAAARHFLNQKGYSQVVVPERCIDLLARFRQTRSSFPLLCDWCARSLHHSSLSIGHGVDSRKRRGFNFPTRGCRGPGNRVLRNQVARETIEQLAPADAALLSLVSVLIDIVHDVRRAREHTQKNCGRMEVKKMLHCGHGEGMPGIFFPSP